MGVNLMKTHAEFDPTLAEDRFMTRRGFECWMISGGPELAAFHVTQIKKSPPAIPRGILAPAGEGYLIPEAVAAARIGDHDVITAVGEQVHFRRTSIRIGEHPQGHFGCAAGFTRGLDFQFMRIQDGSSPGYTFVKQQFRRFKNWIRSKTLLHRMIQ